ncbi:MAG: hypothetical protein V4736_15080 [Bdellovibrionota bacterium]
MKIFIFWWIFSFLTRAMASPENPVYYRECYAKAPLGGPGSISDIISAANNMAQATIFYEYKNASCTKPGCMGWINIYPEGIYKPNITVNLFRHMENDMNHLTGEGVWESGMNSSRTDRVVTVDVTFKAGAGIGSGWNDLGTFVYTEQGVSKELKLSCIPALVD